MASYVPLQADKLGEKKKNSYRRDEIKAQSTWYIEIWLNAFVIWSRKRENRNKSRNGSAITREKGGGGLFLVYWFSINTVPGKCLWPVENDRIPSPIFFFSKIAKIFAKKNVYVQWILVYDYSVRKQIFKFICTKIKALLLNSTHFYYLTKKKEKILRKEKRSIIPIRFVWLFYSVFIGYRCFSNHG